MDQFNTVDFNAESTSDVVKVLCFFRAFYEELNWKFSAWTDDVLGRVWPEISSEHDDVRALRDRVPYDMFTPLFQVLAYISEMLAFCGKIMVSSHIRDVLAYSLM